MNIEVSEFTTHGNIGVISIDSPPVNALGLPVRMAIRRGFEKFEVDPLVEAIVLICRGRTFFAGADIKEFGKPPASPTLHEVHEIIENCDKPTIAAIHGTALGGGLETALVCNYRIADPDAKLGLPEVKLGLIPGAGGTQRLTRIVGPSAALEMMLSGEPLNAAAAMRTGLVDAVSAQGSLFDDSLKFAKSVLARKGPHPKIRDLPVPMGDETVDEILEKARQKYAHLMVGYRAARSITKTVEAAMTLPFEDGIACERDLFSELRNSPESAAQRHIFFAERDAARPPSLGRNVRPKRITRIAILGDASFEDAAARLVAGAGAHVVPSSRGGASPEDLKPDITLCSNSWFQQEREGVDGPLVVVAPSAKGTAQFRSMQNVVGLRFFRPTALGSLLEVIELSDADPALLAGVMRLWQKAGYIPVLTSESDGYIAERVIAAGSDAARKALSDGFAAEDIDKACRAFGLPFSLLDPSPFGPEAGFPGDQIAPQAVLDEPAQEDLERRLVDPMLEEAAIVLKEGVAKQASDVDIAMVAGFNWPPYTGGPLYLKEQGRTHEAGSA
ncbi:MAG: enoyl-CoA hydratase-related protein [Novosphingobium sp.]